MGLRSTRVTLSAAFGLLVASVAACSASGEPDFAQICLNEDTQQRVDEDQCDDPGYVHNTWVYVPRAHGYPAVGEKVQQSTYQYARPVSGTVSTVKPAGLGGSSYGGGGTAGS